MMNITLFFVLCLVTGSFGHVAELTLKKIVGHSYYGVSGTTSVYNPKVSERQTSSSHLWVQKGEEGGINKIVVGWHVSPNIYKDYKTHVYTLWTSDNFKKTGCYNTLCPGFVRLPSKYQIGYIVNHTSVYGGDQYELKVSLLQSIANKNWIVRIEDEDVGYFPANLFSDLNGASEVGWGGSTTAPRGTPSPPMGSGNFPDGSFDHASYFKQITYRDEFGQDKRPGNPVLNQDVLKCYRVDYDNNEKEIFGSNIHFGGPGGECGN